MKLTISIRDLESSKEPKPMFCKAVIDENTGTIHLETKMNKTTRRIALKDLLYQIDKFRK